MIVLPQPPNWLPYRLRNRIDNYRIARVAKQVENLPPYSASAAETAQAEVFMLLCQRDLYIGALSLKSLLRFGEGKLAVTITDDGSLSEADRKWFEQQIPGCRWLPRYVTKDCFVEKLSEYSQLQELYQGKFVMFSKLLHPILLSRSPRVILIDSDTAFFKQPDLLNQWVDGKFDQPLYLHDHQDEQINVTKEIRSLFDRIIPKITPATQQWALDRYFFNAGLLAYEPQQLNLAIAESFLTCRNQLSLDDRKGLATVWFGDWTLEQSCYMTMFAFTEPKAKPLGDAYHLGGGQGYVFNHFLRHYLVQSDTLRMLDGLINKFEPMTQQG